MAGHRVTSDPGVKGCLAFFIPVRPYSGGNVDRVVRTVSKKTGKPMLVPTRSRESKQFQENCRVVALQHRPLRPFEGPVHLQAVLYLPGRGGWPTSPKDGDIDGIIRPILNGFTQGQIWLDDAQVVNLSVVKGFANGGPVGVQVFVWREP